MTQATKRPWIFKIYSQDEETLKKFKLHGINPIRNVNNDGDTPISDVNGRPVCFVNFRNIDNVKPKFRHNSPDDERDANARLIVKAVNCHDELLSVCKWALSCMKNDDTSLKAELEKVINKVESNQ